MAAQRIIEFHPDETDRLDRAILRKLEDLIAREDGFDSQTQITRSQISKWIHDGQVLVGGEPILKPGIVVTPSQMIQVHISQHIENELEPNSSITLDVRYEDDLLLVVNKPAGLLVHPGAERSVQTLCHGLLAHVGESIRTVGHGARPGIVHRLDRDTSGLLIVAKTERSYHALVKQFLPPRTVSRSYLALTRPFPRGSKHDDAGVISLKIGRSDKNRKRMAIKKDGREAVTHYRVEERFSHGMLLRLDLETGRTHQIRVHLEAIGAPIVGDPLYQKAMLELPSTLQNLVKQFGRQALHAERLAFLHPETGQRMEFHAELPNDFAMLVDGFRSPGGSK